MAVYIVDLREEFVRDFVFPMLRANAVYEGEYLLGTSIARPLIAKRQVEVAREGGRRRRRARRHRQGQRPGALRADLRGARARPPGDRALARVGAQLAHDADRLRRRHDIPVPVTAEKPYWTDRNLLHICYEGGILEDPWARAAGRDVPAHAVDPEEAPDGRRTSRSSSSTAIPVAVNGERLAPAALLTRLNQLGGEHGIGRVDLVENRFVGMKSRGVYETPGGTSCTRRTARSSRSRSTARCCTCATRSSRATPRWSTTASGSRPSARLLQALVDECARDVTGTARLKLYKGNVTVAGRKSPRSLYRTDFATFEADRVYRQRDAEGFINLNALRLKIRALRDRNA